MPTLSINKTYADSAVLTETDLDNIKSSIETFVNTTGLDDDNIQNAGITASSKLVDGTITAAKIGTSAVTTAKINDEAVTSAKLATSAVNLVMPAGAVLPYAGDLSTPPSGYLACDGSAVSRTTYATLFAVVGTLHGQGDGSTTFNLPDYRGRFLRGSDDMGTSEGAASRDPDAGSRTAMATGGATGATIGSVQADATARPNTSFTTDTQGAHTHTTTTFLADGSGSEARWFNSGAGTANGSGGNATDSQGAHSHTITGGGDNETRPTNANINYIIKT